jgi:predicted nucleic acid-binding protein
LNAYYDTGILLKLYTAEPESEHVQRFVRLRGKPIAMTDLHWTECVSALRLKAFRNECREAETSAAIELIKADLKSGILRVVEVDWNHAWQECRLLSEQFTVKTGARTLDTLHVAAARLLGAKAFLTSDSRQANLARKIGLKTLNPASK